MRINSYIHQTFSNTEPVMVMEEDWDNLILLDGCRYDVFAELNELDGDLQSRRSAGTSSGEFLEANFRNEETYFDTIYFSANPHVMFVNKGRGVDEYFHSIIDLVHEEEYWDADLHTVHPKTVVDVVSRYQSDFPDKRYIIHFMQPHFPFIGKKSDDLDFNYGFFGHFPDDAHDTKTPWAELPKYGNQEREVVREAYRENLKIVLEHVEELLSTLDGKSVISSDHGNMLGERFWPIPVRGYGHPSGRYVPALTKVPWHVVDSDQRRRIREDPPVQNNKPDTEVTQQRLRDLGYV